MKRREREWCQRIRLTWPPDGPAPRTWQIYPDVDGSAGAPGQDENVAAGFSDYGHLGNLLGPGHEGDEERSASLR